jgi:hypothetical protein
MVLQDRVGRTRRAQVVRAVRLHLLTLAFAACAAGAASAHGQADVCAKAGVTQADAVRVYGHDARVQPEPLIGYGPANLMNVPACFVYRPGNDLAVTVQRYPAKTWSQLVGIYRKLNATERPLSGLGRGSLLFDVEARPGNYEEVVLFAGNGYVVAARPPLVQSARPPVRPSAKLLTLLRHVRERLAA